MEINKALTLLEMSFIISWKQKTNTSKSFILFPITFFIYLFSAIELCDVVKQHDFMDKELILLLVKQKEYDQAIELYLDKCEFA